MVGVGDDLDQLVPVHLLLQVVEVGLHVQAFDRVVDAARHAAQVGGLLDQIGLEALLGQGQGAGHAGDAAADHQGGLVDRQRELLQGLQLGRPRHRHADDVLGLLRGVCLLLGVDPGAVLADVRHVEEVLVDARFAQRVAEQRLVRPGVQAATTTRFSPLSRIVSPIALAVFVAQANRLSSA